MTTSTTETIIKIQADGARDALINIARKAAAPSVHRLTLHGIHAALAALRETTRNLWSLAERWHTALPVSVYSDVSTAAKIAATRILTAAEYIESTVTVLAAVDTSRRTGPNRNHVLDAAVNADAAIAGFGSLTHMERGGAAAITRMLIDGTTALSRVCQCLAGSTASACQREQASPAITGDPAAEALIAAHQEATRASQILAPVYAALIAD